MPVHSISSSPVSQNSGSKFSLKKVIKNPVRDTGYASAALFVGSMVAGYNKNLKLHKRFAIASLILTIAHIGIVEWNKYKWSKRTPKNHENA